MSFTYLGLLDDFSFRHGEDSIRTMAELDAYLIESALFGDSPLINDGYFLSHSALQEAVVNPEGSPLRALVECGFAKILTRNKGDLASLPDLMAGQDIAQAQKVAADGWFKETYRPRLVEWSRRLGSGAFEASWRPWPNIDRDFVFRSVAQTALASLYAAEPEMGKAFDRFQDSLAATKARRTEWEEVGKKLVEDRKIAGGVYKRLMQAASEAYPYSWGCTLANAGDAVLVQTRPRYLGQLDSILGEVSPAPKQRIQVYVPNIAFATRAIKNRWSLLAEMLQPGHEINQLKNEFLALLKAYYLSEGSDEGELKRSLKLYENALSMHFGHPERVAVTFDLTVWGAGVAAGFMVAGLPGAALGAGIGLAGIFSDCFKIPQTHLWRLAAPKPGAWIRQEPSRDAVPVVSSFELSPGEVANHTREAPQYRQ